MTTLTEFLLARIAEDEAACGGGDEPENWCDRATGVHYDPARVLAECEAKRRIVNVARYADEGSAGWGFRRILGDLAAVYGDHPDHREEWRTSRPSSESADPS